MSTWPWPSSIDLNVVHQSLSRQLVGSTSAQCSAAPYPCCSRPASTKQKKNNTTAVRPSTAAVGEAKTKHNKIGPPKVPTPRRPSCLPQNPSRAGKQSRQVRVQVRICPPQGGIPASLFFAPCYFLSCTGRVGEKSLLFSSLFFSCRLFRRVLVDERMYAMHVLVGNRRGTEPCHRACCFV